MLAVFVVVGRVCRGGKVSNLIDITEIAQRLKLRREYVREKLVKTGDFPRPARSLSQRIRRWRAEDVSAWLEQQERAAAQ